MMGVAKYSPNANGLSTDGACLNELYRSSHNPNDATLAGGGGGSLTCNGGIGGRYTQTRFWTDVSFEAPSTCMEGGTFAVGNLTFEIEFMEDARDFAVR